MHELAITQDLVAAVAERVGSARVRRVRLQIGKLSGVVADSVRFCFDVCAAGTVLEGSMLEILEPEGRAHCRTCDQTVAIDDGILLCGCGGGDLRIVSGSELRIDEVEVL